MLRSWKLGTLAGIGLYVHWTFLLPPLYALMAVSEESGKWQLGILYAIGIVCVFACVMLHELGHALMARYFGIQTRDITLYPIGGIARLERMSEKPWEEFWIAVAGPAVNVVIAAFLLLLFVLGYFLSPVVVTTDVANAWADSNNLAPVALLVKLVVFVFGANVVLVCFNMLPAFPMDGGRVLRALLSSWIGHLRATEIAAGLGVVMVGLFVLAGSGFFHWVGLTNVEYSPMLVLVALFVFVAGQQELAVVRHKAAQAQAEPHTMPADGYCVLDAAVTPPEPHFSGFTWDRGAGLWIEWRDGRPFQAHCAE